MISNEQLVVPLNHLQSELKEWKIYLEDLFDTYEDFAKGLINLYEDYRPSRQEQSFPIPGISLLKQTADQLKSKLSTPLQHSLSSLIKIILSIQQIKNIIVEQKDFLFEKHVTSLQEQIKSDEKKIKNVEKRLQSLQIKFLLPGGKDFKSTKIGDEINQTKNELNNLKNSLSINNYLYQRVGNYFNMEILTNQLHSNCKLICHHYKQLSIELLESIYEQLQITQTAKKEVNLQPDQSNGIKNSFMNFKLNNKLILISTEHTIVNLREQLEDGQFKMGIVEDEIEELKQRLYFLKNDCNEEKLKIQFELIDLQLKHYHLRSLTELIGENLNRRNEKGKINDEQVGMFSCLSPLKHTPKTVLKKNKKLIEVNSFTPLPTRVNSISLEDDDSSDNQDRDSEAFLK